MKLRYVVPAALLTALTVACTIETTPAADGGALPVADGGTSSSSGDAGDAGDCSSVGEPNDAREAATAAELGTAYPARCIGGGSDPADFYTLTAPADAAGGYVQVELRGVTGWLGFEVYGADNALILANNGADVGSNVDGYFTVAPGATYQVKVLPYQSASVRTQYDLKLVYTKIVDTFEPNNTRDQAKPITVGTPITASGAVAAAVNVPTEAEQDDWYSLTLAAGNVKIELSNVPSTLWAGFELVDSANAVVKQTQGSNDGASASFTTAVTAGDYKIRVYPYQKGGFRADKDPVVATSVSGQYTLTVTQP